jgi:hypothetical protein
MKTKLKQLGDNVDEYVILATLLIVPIAAFAVLLQHIESVAGTANVMITIAGIAVALGVPTCLIVSVFKRARSFAAFGLKLISYLLGLSLWLWALVLAYESAGVSWTIIGLCCGGVGVVPIAFMAELWRTEWTHSIQIAVAAVALYAVRSISYFIASGAEIKDH